MKDHAQNLPDLKNGVSGVDNELHELLLDALCDLIDAEMQLTKILPVFAEAAQSVELAEALRSHLEETENHVTRLRQVFTEVGEVPRRKTCTAMKILIKEGCELIEGLGGNRASDAALIAASQKVEHHEIASYGAVIAWARQMGHEEAVYLLKESLNEEKAADRRLTELADSFADQKASGDPLR